MDHWIAKSTINWVLIIFLVTGCAPTLSDEGKMGVLLGHVIIGPLLPLQQEGIATPTPEPEIYAERKIVIYAEDGETELERVEIDAQGIYRVELSPGRYVVDINHVGIDQGVGLPKTVVINAGETTTLDVEIDTGIR
jgi:hypothetical protein